MRGFIFRSIRSVMRKSADFISIGSISQKCSLPYSVVDAALSRMLDDGEVDQEPFLVDFYKIKH